MTFLRGTWAAGLTLGVALLSGCGSTTTKPREARKVTSLAPAVLSGDDAFAWSLYGELSKQPGNLFFSPFSITSALGMTYAGARGETAKQMHDVLHVGVGDAKFHAALGGLARDLSGDKRRGYTLYVANRQFGQQGYAFHQDFTDLLKTDYGAELEPIDFAGDPQGARQKVNAWADNATHGTIPPLFPPGSIDSSTVLVLANAIYFKSSWARAFDKSETRDKPFHRADGSTVTVPMMHQKGVFAFKSSVSPAASVVALPYRDNELSMLLVVPDAVDGLPAVEAALPNGWLDEATQKLIQGLEVVVELPRFSMSWHGSLGKQLKTLGMTDAFDASRADLSGIADGHLAIGVVEHSAYVKVDEQGTTAAAATGVGIVNVCSPCGPPSVIADHPFLFVIRDKLTGSLLFIGRVEDPTA